ncbi:type II toxin-antitoxin system VapC family toxin [Agromyces sp. MMS24-JH15]|uniref:type II toxin-antitoxin system VapC family toxin n=1 Tax=Agromyces sp. MMS24-JH15 TaxID=3243765 RepID=UPI003748BD85
MIVLDASALLAFLQGEAGADTVERALETGSIVGAANWSEVAQKVIARGGDWELARALIESYGTEIEPVGRADAEDAAMLWRAGSGLSLADRLCLALAARASAEVLTADAAWSGMAGVRMIR